MKRVIFLLAVIMFLGLFGCGRAEPAITGESTTGTSATTTTTTTEKPREVLITNDKAAVLALLNAYAAGENPENMPDVVDISAGKGWEGFMPYYEAVKSGEDFAVVTSDAWTETICTLTYISHTGGKYYYMRGTDWGSGVDFASDGEYPYILYTEDFEKRTFWLADREDYTLSELKTGEGAVRLFEIENAALWSVDKSIDISAIPTATDDFEQIKAFLAAYSDSATLPDNYPEVWDERGYPDIDGGKFLTFYGNVSAGQDDALVILNSYTGSTEPLMSYLSYANGHFVWVWDSTRVEASGRYSYDIYGYLIKEEIKIGEKNVNVYFLANDGSMTFMKASDSRLSSDKSKWIPYEYLYSEDLD